MSVNNRYISSQGTKVFEINMNTLSWCEFFNLLNSTDIPVDHDNDGNIVLDIPERDLKLISKLFNGGTFGDLEQSEYDSLADSLKYLLFENIYDYPNDVFVRKIEHEFWKSNHNVFANDSNKFAGLKCIGKPIKGRYNIIETHGLPEHNYVAGSYAMYLAGWIDDPRDCDVFSTSKKHTNYHIKQLNKTYNIVSTKYTYTFKFDNAAIRRNRTDEYIPRKTINPGYTEMQFVLVEYQSPSSIVYNFDIDCCKVIYDPMGGMLYAAPMAIFADEKKQNYYDSWSCACAYIHRLIKYACRGYDIWLPHWDPDCWMSRDDFTTMIYKNDNYEKFLWMMRMGMCNDLENISTKAVDLLVMMKLYAIALPATKIDPTIEYYESLVSKKIQWNNKFNEYIINNNEFENERSRWQTRGKIAYCINNYSLPDDDIESIKSWYMSSVYYIK